VRRDRSHVEKYGAIGGMENQICHCFGYSEEGVTRDVLVNNGRSLIMERIFAEKKAEGTQVPCEINQRKCSALKKERVAYWSTPLFIYGGVKTDKTSNCKWYYNGGQLLTGEAEVYLFLPRLIDGDIVLRIAYRWRVL